eukprot:6184123-Pleurochrysis_carterae.AAC.1
MLQSMTSEAQAEAFKESLRETAALFRDVSITEAMEPRILNFVPASTINDHGASAARKAAQPPSGQDHKCQLMAFNATWGELIFLYCM